MSPFVLLLLSLFGAALLGNIIGWFARRIVALRRERALLAQHERELGILQTELSSVQQENDELQHRVSSLETVADEKRMLDETIAATESELSDLRNKSGRLQSALEASDSKVRQLESTIDTLSVQPGFDERSEIERRVPKGLEDYALGSVVSGAADFEVDDDIADLTSDLSEVLTPDLQRELAHETEYAAPVVEQDASVGSEGLFSRFNRKKKS